MINKKQINDFQKEILDWYSKNKRDLPWRKTRDPYAILISEVMLQQTQVARVTAKFAEWMEKFPTIQDVSDAVPRDILLLWSGLGYNRRALYLHKLAKEVTEKYQGIFPQDEIVLRSLPGIGEYTSKAILCFAFDVQAAVVDTNIRKVIAVKFFKNIVPNKKIIEEVAQLLLPKGRAYEWNQALMDYAAVVLKKEKIALPKQKPFKDSGRYYRGEIMRRVLAKGSLSIHDLADLLPNKDNNRLQKILDSLEKDQLIVRKEDTLFIDSN